MGSADQFGHCGVQIQDVEVRSKTSRESANLLEGMFWASSKSLQKITSKDGGSDHRRRNLRRCEKGVDLRGGRGNIFIVVTKHV